MEETRGASAFSRAVFAVKTFLGCHCSMHAAGLTYYSMLAMVPVLCILLLAAKTFGAYDFAKDKIHEKVEELVSNIESGPDDAAAVLPQGDEASAAAKRAAVRDFADQARAIERQVFAAIDKVDVGKLGWIGLAMLVWTVISSIGMVEVSFNEIWGSPPRSFFRRIGVEGAVAVILPLFAALAMSVPVLKLAKDIIVATVGATWLTKWVSDGAVWLLDLLVVRVLVSLFFASLTFGIVYKLLPAKPVKWKYSWTCGAVTAGLFAGWMKVCAIAQVGIAKSSAMYGSFAFLPIILAWLYMSWQIILFGCCLQRAWQEGPQKPPVAQ